MTSFTLDKKSINKQTITRYSHGMGIVIENTATVDFIHTSSIFAFQIGKKVIVLMNVHFKSL